MKLTVFGTDRNGNPIDTLTNPDTIKELIDFLTEVYSRDRVIAENCKKPENRKIAKAGKMTIME